MESTRTAPGGKPTPAAPRIGWDAPTAGPGSHACESIAEIQRARIISAMVAVASERSVGYATVTRVVARSGVSRRTFYEFFEDREDCFLAAFDKAIGQIAAAVLPAYEAPSSWRERIRAALTALLQFLDLERDVARLVIVETLGAGPKALALRQRVLAELIAAVDDGCREVERGEGPPPLTAEGLVGGVLSLIHSRMVDERDAPLIELLNPLMSMIMLPYLGPAAARHELDRAVPQARNLGRKAGTDPLRELDMRLTYRTIRVLLAIGERDVNGSHPSNRKVADAAGIRDQGQVSKMLSRLEQLGLIENAAGPRIKGEPNGWTLTERGEDVRAVVSV
jgi:AcrR family transcriptional regulator/DNA-binding MarR family transcriptional regulator